MVSPKSKITVISTVSLLAFALGSTSPVAQTFDPDTADLEASPIATAMIGGEFIDFSTHIEFDFAVLRIAGPQQYAASLRFSGHTPHITADLLLDAEPMDGEDQALDDNGYNLNNHFQQLPNGPYRYELVLMANGRVVGTKVGQFVVEDHLALEIDTGQDFSSIRTPSRLQKVGAAILNIVFPQAHAQTLEGSRLELTSDLGAGPRIAWDQGSDGIDWFQFANKTNGWWLSDRTDDSVSNDPRNFQIAPGSANHSLVLGPGFPSSNAVRVGVGTAAPLENLHIVSSTNAARIRLENTATAYRLTTGENTGFALEQRVPVSTTPFRIEPGAPTNSIRVNSTGNVGVGTASMQSFHRLTVDGNMAIGRWIDFTDQSGRNRLEIGPNGMSIRQDNRTQFLIARDAPLSSMVILNDRIFLNDNLRIGSGTTDPQAALHIRRSDGTAGVILEESQAIDINQQVTMRSNGNTGFRFENTRDNSEWQFRTGGPGGSSTNFLINRAGTGQAEFIMDQNGNASFRGNVTANGVQLTSSRAAKTSIAPLNSHVILAKLDALEISKWRYKGQPESAVHVGPMAEDFHEIFGLSDGKTINMIDTNGIAFAAIQALSENNRELRERVATLEDYILQSKSNL